MAESGADQRPNFIYYFDIGLGDWQGKFLLTVTNWRKYWADHLGLKNRFLSLSLFVTLKLVGSAPITSHLDGDPKAGRGGVVANRVRISKFGLTLYLLEEHYYLDPDGTNIQVQADERFGPIPFLFKNHKEHPAEATNAGMRAVYYIPLLGTEWTATYTVAEDRTHIHSAMVCAWAEGHEIIHKTSRPG